MLNQDYNHSEYLALSPEERLMQLQEDMKYATKQEQIFIRGRMLEITINLIDHPANYDWDCLCNECVSYGT